MLVQRKGNILVRTALTVTEKKEENEDKEQKFKAPFFLFWELEYRPSEVVGLLQSMIQTTLRHKTRIGKEWDKRGKRI